MIAMEPRRAARLLLAAARRAGSLHVLFDPDQPKALAARRKETLVHRAADAHAPKLSVGFRYAFAAGRKKIAKVDKGAAPEIVANDAAVAVAQALGGMLQQTLLKALAAGGDAGLEMLGLLAPKIKNIKVVERDAEELRTAAPKIVMRFDVANESAARWAKRHAGELIKDVSETTRKRVRLAVEELQEEGDFEFARDRILAAVGDEERANLIARHESHLAASEGQRQGWAQAVDEGLLTGDERRVWIVTGDDKVCPICEGLEDKRATLDGAYRLDGEEYDGPPAHVACRCTEGIA